MATESIGSLIPTAIPGYADAADIQAALRAYHYGSYEYDPGNTSPANLEASSIAKYIYDIEQDIISLENRPYLGEVSDTAPVPGDFTPVGIPDGFIWLDSDGDLGGGPVSATAAFTLNPPSLYLTSGLLWIDKDPTDPLPVNVDSLDTRPGYVYDEDTSTWYGISPAASLAGLTDVVLTSPTTNQILAYNGTAWVNSNESGDITAVTSGTGITVTNSTGPIPSVAVDTTVVATTNNSIAFSNKTISGTSNTIINVPISTGISGLGTGVATFLATPSSANLISAITDETGTGALVFGTSPTIATPTLTLSTTSSTTDGRMSWDATNDQLKIGDGTTTRTLSPDDKATTLTNKTISGSNNTISNIANASLTNSAVTVNGTSISLGSSGTITVPVSTGVTGLGTGIATFLATPSSANLISAITDETGTGSLVFGTSPTITPAEATTSTATTGAGYMGIPQNSTTTGAYRLVAADAGKHIYSSATRTITIPGATTGGTPQVNYPIGTTIVFIAGSGATVTLQMDGTTTDTCLLAGVGTSMTGGSGSRTLAQFGMATLVKITSTSWIISGNGLS